MKKLMCYFLILTGCSDGSLYEDYQWLDDDALVLGFSENVTLVPTEVDTEAARTVGTLILSAKNIQEIAADTTTELRGSKVAFAGGGLEGVDGADLSDVKISIEPAASDLGAEVFSEIGLETDNEITQSGVGVLIMPSEDVVVTKPFKLVIPHPGGGSLGLFQTTTNLAVLYRGYNPETKEFFSGVIPGNKISITDDGLVEFDTLYFGAYQSVVLKKEIVEVVKQVSKNRELRSRSGEVVATSQGIAAKIKLVDAYITNPIPTYSIISIDKDSHFSLEGYCSENGFKVVILIDNQSSYETSCNENKWQKDALELNNSPGSYNLKLTHFGKNSQGSEVAKEKTYTLNIKAVAIQKPTIDLNINYPEETREIRTDNLTAFVVGGTCTHNDGVIDIFISQNNTNKKTESSLCNKGSWTKTLNLNGLSVGAFSLIAKFSYEGADSVEKTKTYNHLPNKASAYFEMNEFVVDYTNYSNYPAKGSCSSNSQKVAVYIAGILYKETTCTDSKWEVYVDFSKYSPGEIKMSVEHYNEVGEKTSSDALAKYEAPVRPSTPTLSGLTYYEDGYGVKKISVSWNQKTGYEYVAFLVLNSMNLLVNDIDSFELTDNTSPSVGDEYSLGSIKAKVFHVGSQSYFEFDRDQNDDALRPGLSYSAFIFSKKSGLFSSKPLVVVQPLCKNSAVRKDSSVVLFQGAIYPNEVYVNQGVFTGYSHSNVNLDWNGNSLSVYSFTGVSQSSYPYTSQGILTKSSSSDYHFGQVSCTLYTYSEDRYLFPYNASLDSLKVDVYHILSPGSYTSNHILKDIDEDNNLSNGVVISNNNKSDVGTFSLSSFLIPSKDGNNYSDLGDTNIFSYDHDLFLKIKGKIYIPETKDWAFRLSSKAATILYIDNTLVVDGQKPVNTSSLKESCKLINASSCVLADLSNANFVSLTQGFHDIEVNYFMSAGDKADLKLEIITKSPDNSDWIMELSSEGLFSP